MRVSVSEVRLRVELPSGHVEEITPRQARELVSALARVMPEFGVGPQRAVLALVQQTFAVTAEELFGLCREPHIVQPRQVASYLLRIVCGWSLARVAAVWDQDHGTARHSCAAVQNRMETEEQFGKLMENLKKELEHTLRGETTAAS